MFLLQLSQDWLPFPSSLIAAGLSVITWIPFMNSVTGLCSVLLQQNSVLFLLDNAAQWWRHWIQHRSVAASIPT